MSTLAETTPDADLSKYRPAYGLPGDIRERDHTGAEFVRWISVEPIPHEDVSAAERMVAFYAVSLADAVMGDEDEWRMKYHKEDYATARAKAARLRDIYDRCWRNQPRTGQTFRAPGAIVSVGDWEASA